VDFRPCFYGSLMEVSSPFFALNEVPSVIQNKV